jgi:VanZ family protein
MSLASWLAPLAWMAVLLALSSDAGSSGQTGAMFEPLLRWLLPWATPRQLDAVHIAIRKAAHVTVYAILAALWFRALVRHRRWSPRAAALVAFGAALAWAIVDEIHQTFTTTRTGAPGDVAIDAMGALLAVFIGALGWSAAADRATGILLWLGALGGAAALVIAALLGVALPFLWVAVPAAALLLVIRHRQRLRGG